MQAENWDDAYSIICTDRPPTWRLVHNAISPNETSDGIMDDEEPTDLMIEEVMLGIQGIVV
jgi:hypothetical protein